MLKSQMNPNGVPKLRMFSLTYSPEETFVCPGMIYAVNEGMFMRGIKENFAHVSKSL